MKTYKAELKTQRRIKQITYRQKMTFATVLKYFQQCIIVW